MKYALMQPYFFPYLGYYSLMNYVDKWVFFDEAQYIKAGWINRNRILNNSKEWCYFNLPLKKNRYGTPINELITSENFDWRYNFLNKLKFYKNKAPYYKQVIEIIESVIYIKSNKLIDYLINSSVKICEYLDISFSPILSSSLEFDRKKISNVYDWLIQVGQIINADDYINLPGGSKIYDKKTFMDKNIKLSFIKNNLSPYDQRQEKFIPGLSIIDVLMFNSIEDSKNLINDCLIF